METAVPVVLFGRFTTGSGDAPLTTLPVGVVPYQSAEMFVWRSQMPSGGTYEIVFEESMDQQTWSRITTVTTDPGADQEATITFDLTMAWLHAIVTLGAGAGVFPVATWYCVGRLITRG